MTGTEKLIGFLMKTQRPLDEHYLNDGVAWADEAEVLAGIPSTSRSPYKFVNIAGVLYWFKSNLTEIEPVTIPALVAAGDVSIADAAGIYEATNVESALQEVMGEFLALSLEFEAFKTNNYTVNNYTVYNANTLYAEFLCVDPNAPVIPLDEFGNPITNASITLLVRDTQVVAKANYGYEPITGLFTFIVPLVEGERLYINYKKSTVVQS